jgi:hypothetical protein
MVVENASQTDRRTSRRRWFHATPDRLILGLLAVECLLWASERFRWFPKGWAVLIALATVGVAMLLMLVSFVLALVFRWRFQFSVRSLLVLVLAVALPCSWLAVEMKKAGEERRAVAAIEKLGGLVDWDDNALLPPRWLWSVLGDDFFNNVVGVGLDGTKVSDAGLEKLKRFGHLRWLFLGSTSVGDAGLKHFQGLSRLQWLDLNGTHVSDAGLEKLKPLRELEWLDLNGSTVSDAGLDHLKGFNQLRWLGLIRTQVTVEGVKRLQQALPKCQIVYWHDQNDHS